MNLLKKILKDIFYFLIFNFLIIVSFLVFTWTKDFSLGKKPIFGITFSQSYSEYIGLDWRENYLAILDDLGVKNLRLVAYWDRIERTPSSFDFSDLDWQISEAKKRNAKIILAIGRRTPRWPECHAPSWVKGLKTAEEEERLLIMIRKVIGHYHDEETIVSWQVENEPLLNVFGECPKADRNFLKKEVAFVKYLDSRPVLISDSGELSSWLRTASLSDFFGTTMYRIVWNPWIGYYTHVLPPSYYYYKAKIVQLLLPNVKKIIISELQAEPWSQQPLQTLPIDKQKEIFNVVKLRENIELAKRTGLSEVYLWGVEWWYWLKIHGEESYWLEAKKLWR
ncbi:MAG: hypothetical protein V1892_00270 [bacterium]